MEANAECTRAKHLLQPKHSAELHRAAEVAFHKADRNGNGKLEWARGLTGISHNEVMEFVANFFQECGLPMPRNIPEQHWWTLKGQMDTNNNQDLEQDEAECHGRKCLELAFPTVLPEVPDDHDPDECQMAAPPPPTHSMQIPVDGKPREGAWNIDDTFELCDEGTRAQLEGLVFSTELGVESTVNGLNNGSIERPEDDCIAVLSPRLGKYFVLHSPEKKEEAVRKAEAARWRIENTFEICDKQDKASFESKATFLSGSQASGVTSAVKGLKEGTIETPPSGFCIVFSESTGKYYCVFAAGRRKHAIYALGFTD